MTRVETRILKSALLGASAVAMMGFVPAHAMDGDMNLPQGQLQNAVQMIEQKTNGHVVEIKEHAGAFDAIVASGHRDMQAMRLDASNAITPLATADDLRPVSRFRARDAQRTRVDLSQAILKAQEFMPGRAVAADFTEAGAITAYNVEVNQDGHMQRVVVDAQSGEIIADPQGLPS